jgi:hypothetical protein
MVLHNELLGQLLNQMDQQSLNLLLQGLAVVIYNDRSHRFSFCLFSTYDYVIKCEKEDFQDLTFSQALLLPL